jgi:hypothetical protein
MWFGTTGKAEVDCLPTLADFLTRFLSSRHYITCARKLAGPDKLLNQAEKDFAVTSIIRAIMKE